MSSFHKITFSLTVVLLGTISGCTGQEMPKVETKNLYQNNSDILNKYSIEQLHDALTKRSNKSIYGSEPEDLRAISSSSIADDIILRQKTIYGPNRQRDYFEIQDPEVLRVANSVAAMITTNNLQATASGFQISKSCPSLGDQYHLCSKESYSTQPVPSVCTAFVVASDVIATAGHCVPWLGSSRIVFGFRAEKNSGQVQVRTLIPASQIYTPMQVIAQKTDAAGADFALVRVDRPILDHPPLRLHTEGDIAKGTIVYVLGHPSGLPVKLADSAIVSEIVPNGYFVSNLDTFGGNSGSPVFNEASNIVEGILVRGGTDYKSEGTCNRAFVCPLQPNGTTDCSGEAATLMSQLADSLKSIESSDQKAATDRSSIVKTFRSGEMLSGSGANFSREYELVSDPAPSGFKIGNYVFSLTGDRGCNAWSTCRAGIEGNKVVFRFSLQGHNEWPPPGQAKSEGFLTVTYVASQ